MENPTKQLFVFVPEWRCRSCGKRGALEGGRFAPIKCPGCGSTKIESDPVKLGGPFDDEIEGMKKY